MTNKDDTGEIEIDDTDGIDNEPDGVENNEKMKS